MSGEGALTPGRSWRTAVMGVAPSYLRDEACEGRGRVEEWRGRWRGMMLAPYELAVQWPRGKACDGVRDVTV